MTQHRPSFLVSLTVAGTLLTACSGGTTTGQPTAAPVPAPVSSSDSGPPSSSDAAPPADVPTVPNPLPASALGDSPCDTALTAADITEFIGESSPAKQAEDPTGQNCFWSNASGNRASIGVTYQTKIAAGLRLAYQNVKPEATRWDELAPIQGYPAVGYLASGDDLGTKYQCEVLVGVADNLAYSVSMILSTNAEKRGIDACAAGKDVADRVLTNIKRRN